MSGHPRERFSCEVRLTPAWLPSMRARVREGKAIGVALLYLILKLLKNS